MNFSLSGARTTKICLILLGILFSQLGLAAQSTPQTITFDPPASLPANTPQLLLSANASSGLPVTFLVVSGPAGTEGNQLNFSGNGVVVVSAIQAGNEEFLPTHVDRTIVVADPPVILQQPSPLNVAAGTPASLEVTAGGTEPLTYKWRRNGGTVSGGTQRILTLSPVNAQRVGLYSVVVANAAGSVTSSVVSLTIDLPGSELSLRPRGSISGFATGAGSGSPVRIAARGNHAFVANGWGTALHVVDVSDPEAPAIVAQVPANGAFGHPFDVALIDNFALTAERGDGLGIIDISNPQAPARVTNFKLPGSLANSVTIRGRKAFVGNENAGVVILDVNTPNQPVIIGSTSPPANANGLHLAGDLAYVGTWAGGLSVVDISNTSQPIQQTAIPYGTGAARAFDAIARGGIVFMADADLGLVVIDPARATGQQLSRFGGSVWDVSLAGRYLLAADASAGFRVFDVSSPTNTIEIGRYSDRGPALGAFVRGNQVYLGERRFSIVELEFAAMAPFIVAEPEERQVTSGSDVMLEAHATGTEPMTYRWFHGSTEIQNASPVLGLAKISQDGAGQYSVVVANAYGTTTNLVANLAVIATPELPRILPDTVQLTGGQIRFRIRKAPGLVGAVMASNDLKAWRELVLLSGEQSDQEIIDDQGTESGAFYRIELR